METATEQPLPTPARFRVTDTPIWRQPCFFGEFGDAYIQDSDLEGAPTEPSLVALCDMIAKCCQQSKTDLTLFSKEDLELMRSVHTDLISCLDFARICSSSDDGFVQSVDRMVTTLNTMDIDDRQVLLGGWSSKTKSAHAIVCMVERTGEDTYAWVCCNTGQGVESYHPLTYVGYPERKCKTAIRFDGIEKHRICNPDVWYMILKQTNQASDMHTPETLYEVILPHLLGKPTFELRDLDLPLSGHWERPQKAGTCYYRCLISALRYLMKAYDFTIDQQRQLFVYIRVNYLKVVQQHLQLPQFLRTLNDSDIYLIHLACQETGLMADKMCSRLERLGCKQGDAAALQDFLSDIQNHCSRVLVLLPGAGEESDQNQLSVADISASRDSKTIPSTAQLMPFKGFDLLFDESDRESKKGYRASGSVPVYLDLLCPLTRTLAEGENYSLEEHVEIFTWCLEKCDAIRSRSNITSINTVLYQLSSFVEFVFMSIVECPSEFSYDSLEEGENKASLISGSIWHICGDLSYASQRKGIYSLAGISHHYVSAVLSMTAGVTERAVHTFTMGTIYAFSDAIMRVCTGDSGGDKNINGVTNSPVASLLQTMFGAGLSNSPLFDSKSMTDIVDAALISRPEVAVARNNLFNYQLGIRNREEKMNLKNIFNFKVISDQCLFICFSAEEEMITFIQALRATVDPDLVLEPELPTGTRAIETGEKLSDTESAFSWFSSDWTQTCPEFAHYRDICFLFQLMWQPDHIFAGYELPEEKNVWSISDARPMYSYASGTRDKTTVYFYLRLAQNRPVFPAPEKAPTALSIEKITNCTPLTETRLLAMPNLPNFDNSLTPQESEQLFSYLAFPHVAIPLMLNFFCGDRIGLLMNIPIQNLVESVLLQPGRYQSTSSVTTASEITHVPVASKAALGTRYGILMEETMYNSPRVLIPLRELCEEALALCIGGYQSSVVHMLLFLVRQCVRILSMCVYNKQLGMEVVELAQYLSEVIGRRVKAMCIAATNDNSSSDALLLYCHSAIIFAVAVDIHLSADVTSPDLNTTAAEEPSRDYSSDCIEEFLCAAGYVVSWNRTGVGGMKSDEDTTSVSTTAPVADVFHYLQKLKGKITKWSKTKMERMNIVLDKMVSCSLQHPFSECGGWRQSNNSPLVCSLLVENDQHPYPPCSDWSQTVSFPGVRSINVYFDPRSCTEAGADYVRISYPGCSYQYSGPAQSQWPGAHGTPPLVVPADTFVVEFHSDGSIQEWGFAFTAVAQINPQTTQMLVAESGLSALACQVALRECQHFVEAARQLIVSDQPKLLLLEEREIAVRKHQHESDASPGLFQDSIDYVQVNIQSAEVFINNRVSIPVPSDILSNKHFRAVFNGLDVPSCTISANHTNRICFQILCPEEKHGCYEVEAWTPLMPYGVTGSGRAAVIRDPSDVSDNGQCTAHNLPLAAPVIEFAGVKFNGYVKGSCGWLSELFDLTNLLGTELEGVWCSENATSLPALDSPVREQEEDAFMLVKTHCATDGQDLLHVIGHPGAWFEIYAPAGGNRRIFAYSLVDHGRRTQRELVFSTSGRSVLKTLEKNPTERTTPSDPLLDDAAGNIMGGFKDWTGELVSLPGVGKRMNERVGSMVIRRPRLPIVDKDEASKTVDVAQEDNVFCAKGGILTRDQLEEMENFPTEEYVPPSVMSSLIPECLTENYQCWRTGSRVIRGYSYKKLAGYNRREREEDSLLVILDADGRSATVHKLIHDRRQYTLLDITRLPHGSDLAPLIAVLSEVETLSHLLVWTRTPYADSEGLTRCEVTRIELTRLKTSLNIRYGYTEGQASPIVDFVLSDHDDFALQILVPREISARWGKIGNFLVFANSSGQYFLFLPNFGFTTPSVRLCPFMSNPVYDRSSRWFQNVDTRFYVYPVHPAFTYLEFPDLSAALYWTVLAFVRHQYTVCAELIKTVCRPDLKLSREQRWILSLVPKSETMPNMATYSHPDANACRLMLAGLCLECGENIASPEFEKQFWSVEKDYKSYLLKISYLSHACRLTMAQETTLLGVFGNVSQIRTGYLEAIADTQRRMQLNNQQQTDKMLAKGEKFKVMFPVLPARIYTKVCTPPKLFDILSVLRETDVPNAPRRRRAQRKPQKICYERPKFTCATDMMTALNSVWNSFEFSQQSSWSSEFAYSGFILLYEMLTGEVILGFQTSKSATPDKIMGSFWKPQSQEATTGTIAGTGHDNSNAEKEGEADAIEIYMEAAHGLLESGMIPDLSAIQLARLLGLYAGNQEALIEDYFSDEDAVLAKLAAAEASASTGSSKVCSEGTGTMDYADAAQALYDTALLPDVSVQQLAQLLKMYEGKNDALIEDYFSDADAVMAKLCTPLASTSEGRAYLKEANGMFSAGILEGLDVDEIVKLLQKYNGNAEVAISAYFENPDAVKKAVLEFQPEVATAPDVAAAKTPQEPSAFPVSWQCAKLMINCLCLQFPALRTRKEMCILLALLSDVEQRVDELQKTGRHTIDLVPPLFPYESYKSELRSLGGMDHTAYDDFIGIAAQYATYVVYEEQYRDAPEPADGSSRLEEFQAPFNGFAYPDPVHPAISDYSCSERSINVEALNKDDHGCTAEEMKALITTPLQELSCFQHIVCSARNEVVTSIPFDLSEHPSAAGNPPAQAMLHRINADLAGSNTATEQNFSFFTDLATVRTAEDLIELLNDGSISQLKNLIQELRQFMTRDTKAVLDSIAASETAMNGNAVGEDTVEWKKFQFKYAAGRRNKIWFEYFVASLSSTSQMKDLQTLNPFLDEETILLLNSRVILMIMRFVRARQASVCIQRANVLLRTIGQLQKRLASPESSATQCADAVHILRHEVTELVAELRKERHYVSTSFEQPTLDPRYLIFEFLTGFLLRKRQVELVTDFIAAHKQGRSSVHQMIMGAGKTQVIAPLLSLMLADGQSLVTVVCPSPLLQQSRTQFRNRFSSVLQKTIITLKFERAAPEFSSPEGLQALLEKLQLARAQKAIVLTNPQSIKSMMLKYIDLLLQIRKLPANLRVFTADSCIGGLDLATATDFLGSSLQPFRTASTMADILGKILKLWGREEKGIALLDEVDLILHPLKSELNFPIGNSEALPMMPERFELPMHLLDIFLSHEEASKVVPHSHVHIWNEIKCLVETGREQMAFQSVPHLVLLNEAYYFTEMVMSVSKWALTWLYQQVTIKADLEALGIAADSVSEEVQSRLLSYLCCYGPERADASSFVAAHFSNISVQLLNLSRDWVLIYLPHVMSKIHRVSYGLIGDADVARWRDQEIASAGGDASAGSNVVISKSRRLLAVPFDGKDAPSRTSEFANPEIQIGLSIAAYRLNGLRSRDAKELVSHLKRSFSTQPGPFRGRPARIQFEEWKAQCVVDAGHNSHLTTKIVEILPLELLQASDDSQKNLLKETLGKHSNVISYYLSMLVFPLALEQKAHKIQANGVDLGGDMIFGSRFGFSGTPSDLLPLQLQPCHFEKGCEAEVFRVLSSPLSVSVPPLLDVGHNWSVDILLDRVANGGYSALIDTGALITGYTAEEVARKLLQLQKSDKQDKKEVCVYLNEHDVKMAVSIEGGPPIELDRCGAKLEKRFVFYDHVHTTGIDIKHSLNAVAVCTMGKDMTLRDYAQGCWRMRGLGKGQTIHLLLVEEVCTLVNGAQQFCDDNASTGGGNDEQQLLNKVLAWLLTNSFKSEKGQFLQLQTQSLADVWRRSAYELLMKEHEFFAVEDNRSTERTITTRSKLLNPLSKTEFQKLQFPPDWVFGGYSVSTEAAPAMAVDLGQVMVGFDTPSSESHMLQLAVDLFLEPTSSEIDSSPEPNRGRSTLLQMQEQTALYNDFIQSTASGPADVQAIMSIVSHATQGPRPGTVTEEDDDGIAYNDREIVQEQEKEKDEEREREVFQVVRPEDDGDQGSEETWELDGLFDYAKQTRTLTFYPLRDLVINEAASPSKLQFPGDLLISQLHAPYFHVSTGSRRLKNVSCLLAWYVEEPADASAPSDEDSVAQMAIDNVADSAKTEAFFSFFGVAKKWNSGAHGNVHGEDADVPKTYNLKSLRCCIVSLAEAETLQYIINRRPELRRIVSLHCVDSALAGVPLTEPLESRFGCSPQFQQKFDTLVQCSSYFNNNLYFDYHALVLLLDSLAVKSTAAEREVMFKETLLGRLRDQNNYKGSPVNWLFIYDTKEELTKLRHYCSAFQQCLEKHFASFTLAFEHFSMGKLRQLSPAHICDGLIRLSTPILSLAESEAMVGYIWNSRQRSGTSIGLSLLDFEMLFPLAPASSFDKLMSSLALDDDVDTPRAPQMMRQKSSQQQAVNEFYSRIHIPSIPSIGKWIVVGGGRAPTDSSPAASRARINMAIDRSVQIQGITKEDGLVTISPRAVTFHRDEESVWCFEVTVLIPGALSIGFANSSHQHLSTSYQAMDLAAVAAGVVVRVIVDMVAETVSYWTKEATDVALLGSHNYRISRNDLDFSHGIYPYITMDCSVRIQLNDGSIPFSSIFGAMPTGCRSLGHWIRREQERNYVCYRNSLGTYGRMSYMSGAQELDVVKLENWSPNTNLAATSPSKRAETAPFVGSPIAAKSMPEVDASQVWELRPPKDKLKNTAGRSYKASFPTIFLDGVLLTEGQWYYEVTCGCKNVAVQLGWSDLDSLQSNDGGLGVGDDKHSWAIDGDRRCLWHVSRFDYGKEWKIGDVCGIACNLDVNHRSISFSLNGEWFQPIAFPNIDFSVGLTPALTVQGVQPGDKKALSYIANFGPHFKHPPGGQYRPVSDYISYGTKKYLSPNRGMGITPVCGDTEVEHGPDLELEMPEFTTLSRQASAQPSVALRHQLKWVPIAVRSGHGQVSVDAPVFNNGPVMAVIGRGEKVEGSCVRNTIISTTGHDDSSYPSVVADQVILRSGKWFFEVDIQSITASAACSIGFAQASWNEANWTASLGVGDDSGSWGVFYKAGLAVSSNWSGQSPELPFFFLSESDSRVDGALSVCVAVDFESKKMLLSINNGPIITVFKNMNFPALVPAISAQARGSSKKKRSARDSSIPDQTKLEVNFGERLFSNLEFLSEGYLPVLRNIDSDAKCPWV